MISNRFYCYYYSDTPNAMVTGELDKIMSVSCPNCNGRIEACRRRTDLNERRIYPIVAEIGSSANATAACEEMCSFLPRYRRPQPDAIGSMHAAARGGARGRLSALSGNPAAIRSLAVLLTAGLALVWLVSFLAGSRLPEDATGTAGGSGTGFVGGLFGTSAKPKKKKRFSGLRKKIGDKAQKIKSAIKAKIHRGAPNAAAAGAIEAKRGQQHRIAIVIPYFSSANDPSLPPYFDLFAQSAGGSADLVDFLIFHTGLPSHVLPDPSTLPPNVKLIDLQSTTKLAELLLRVTDRRTKESLKMDRPKLTSMITKTIEHHPYVLVEYKPATGHIFADYLTDYSHWGYSDLDIIWGDLPRWITKEELTDWDLVTYGFGDQDRVYLRGQFTFHKNNDKINQLWRGCDYLSEADVRYSKLLEGSEQFKLESAEGCYSAAVLHTDDIKVKYTVKALTDAEGAGADSAILHGLYVGLGQNGDRSVVWTAGVGEGDGQKLLNLPMNWFEDEDIAYGYFDVNNPLQWEVGERTKVRSYRDEYGNDDEFQKCMYWAPKTYQRDICVKDVRWFDHTVMLINGQLYKQKIETYAFPNRIVSYPFFHFQEWKRYFRRGQLRAVEGKAGVKDLAGWIISEDGALPIPQPYSNDDLALEVTTRLSHWVEARSVGLEAESSGASTTLPSRKYCLRFSPHKVGGGKSRAIACDEPVSWRDESQVIVLHAGDEWSDWKNAVADVTLALTAQYVHSEEDDDGDDSVLSGLLDTADSNIAAWSGQPSILLIHVAGATRDIAERVHERYRSNPKMKHSLVAAIFTENALAVSRNALLNMASEAAWTRWVVTGLEVERGLVMSKESLLFARRASISHSSMAATALLIPQFGTSKETTASLSVTDLLKDLSSINEDMSALDCEKCANDGGMRVDKHIVQQINSIWKDSTKKEVGSGVAAGTPAKESTETARASAELNALLIQLLQRGQSKSLRHYDQSPIILLDALGPESGTLTSGIAPAPEELAGSRCYNALRLSQLALLGYGIGVVPGAFAASTKSTRKSICGKNAAAATNTAQRERVFGTRCSACFMYGDEDVLKDLAMDERARAADAAVFWRELKKQTERNA